MIVEVRGVNSQQGSAIIFVIVLCAALLFLGISLLELNSVDLQIAVNQQDSLQAYYLAVSGMEGTLAVLKNNPDHTGETAKVLAEGTVNVTVVAVEEDDGARHIAITSRGKSGRVQEEINLEFQSFPSPAGGSKGALEGWYDQTDGKIMPGEHISENSIVLLGCTSMDFPLTLCAEGEEEGSHVQLAATELFFLNRPSSLLLEDTLELVADRAVFHGNISMCPLSGGLRFIHREGGMTVVYIHDQAVTFAGQVLLKAGAYHFPHGYRLTADSDLHELESFRVLPLVPGTMLQWGRE